jgi:hypothetical protein
MGRDELTDEEIVDTHKARKARRNARDRAKRQALRPPGTARKPGPDPDEKKRTQAALAAFGLSIGAVKKGDGVAGTEPATRKEIAAMLKIPPATLRKRIGRALKRGKGDV